MEYFFSNRRDAGELLARKVASMGIGTDVVVLGLPRGGVPIAYEIALRLHAALDVFTVRKLGVPGNEELAMGAIATGGVRVLNNEVIEALRISADVIDAVGDEEERELLRRERAYRLGSEPPDLKGKLVILADDGIATGSTMLAAVKAVKRAGAAAVVVAAPVAAKSSVARLEKVAERVVVLSTPEPFNGVGQWYQDFDQVTDEEVREYLRLAGDREVAAA